MTRDKGMQCVPHPLKLVKCKNAPHTEQSAFVHYNNYACRLWEGKISKQYSKDSIVLWDIREPQVLLTKWTSYSPLTLCFSATCDAKASWPTQNGCQSSEAMMPSIYQGIAWTSLPSSLLPTSKPLGYLILSFISKTILLLAWRDYLHTQIMKSLWEGDYVSFPYPCLLSSLQFTCHNRGLSTNLLLRAISPSRLQKGKKPY